MAAAGIIAGVSLASSFLSTMGQRDAAFTQAAGYEWDASRHELMAEYAVMAADFNNMKLQRQYNDIQAQQVVMGAVQGRSGGSLAAIAKADAEELAWDQEYMRLTGQQEALGHKISASKLRSAAMNTRKNANLSAATGMLQSGVSTYRAIG